LFSFFLGAAMSNNPSSPAAAMTASPPAMPARRSPAVAAMMTAASFLKDAIYFSLFGPVLLAQMKVEQSIGPNLILWFLGWIPAVVLGLSGYLIPGIAVGCWLYSG
jgi:hypothetical protein